MHDFFMTFMTSRHPEAVQKRVGQFKEVQDLPRVGRLSTVYMSDSE